jgi:hypothetical protein
MHQQADAAAFPHRHSKSDRPDAAALPVFLPVAGRHQGVET